MSTEIRKIGFIGNEAYDFILYTAQLLKNMNFNVLIADYSEYGGLTFCIPIPYDLKPEQEKICHQGIDFIRDNKEIVVEGYDYILIDFGFRTNHEDIKVCDKLILVTDMQQQYISALIKLEDKEKQYYLIVKNEFHKKNIDYIVEYLKENGIYIKQSYGLNYNIVDYDNKINLQYINKSKLKKLSSNFKVLLNQLMIDVLELEYVMIKEAYKDKRRGA